MQIRTLSLGLMLVGLGVFVTGCGPATTDQNPAAAPSAAPDADHSMHPDDEAHQDTGGDNGAGNHDEHAHGHGAGMEEEANPNLVQLSEADRMAAREQGVCPVSGEALGSMGAPIKVDVNGQSVWICCPGCKEKLLANPDEYLAKLNK